MEHTIFQHPCLEEAIDRAQHARIIDPMPQETHEMFVADIVEESLDVHLDHPLRVKIRDDFRNPPESVVRSQIGSVSIRTTPELRLPDCLEDLTEPILDNPVLKARYPKRSNTPVGFRNVHPQRRLRTIFQSPQSFVYKSVIY